jgi:Zn-dependent protease
MAVRLLVIAAFALLGIAALHTKVITSTDVILFCVVVPSIMLHEISHGVVALGFGDDTAKRAGRLTLNPLAHVDPVGTIIVPAFMAISGVGVFGWAKPVPVTLSRLRSPRNQGVLVSLAGPATNVLLAGLGALVFVVVCEPRLQPGEGLSTFDQVVFLFGLANVGLAVFNLIPLPPLDGSVLLERLLPASWWPGYLRIRPFTMPLVLVLVVLNWQLHPGPITWLYQEIYTWWASLFNLTVS